MIHIIVIIRRTSHFVLLNRFSVKYRFPSQFCFLTAKSPRGYSKIGFSRKCFQKEQNPSPFFFSSFFVKYAQIILDNNKVNNHIIEEYDFVLPETLSENAAVHLYGQKKIVFMAPIMAIGLKPVICCLYDEDLLGMKR